MNVPEQDGLQIGAKLKELRRRRKITLSTMAADLGMSYSYLSQLENDKYSISLANLQKILSYFDLDMVGFFAPASPAATVKEISQSDTIRYITQDGLQFQILTAGFSENLEVSRIHHPAHSPEDHRLYHHKNGEEEFITVLKGEIYLQIETMTYHVKEGESILFDARLNHTIYTQEQEADILLISSPPSGHSVLP